MALRPNTGARQCVRRSLRDSSRGSPNAAMWAPMSRCRIRKRRSRPRSRTTERARSGRPIRFGSRMGGCIRPIPTSRVSSAISTHRLPGWDRGLETAIVLGAGGGACAVVFGLIERGVPRIEVVNRSMARAQALCRRLGAQVRAASWETLGALLPACGLLVNTTSLGMKGQAALELDVTNLPEHAAVADIVYVPLRTRLLEAARHAACARRTGSACCCIRPCAGFRCGSACSRR